MSADQNKTVFIVGAGRQGRNALEILTLRYRIEGFLDNFCKVGEIIKAQTTLVASA